MLLSVAVVLTSPLVFRLAHGQLGDACGVLADCNLLTNVECLNGVCSCWIGYSSYGHGCRDLRDCRVSSDEFNLFPQSYIPMSEGETHLAIYDTVSRAVCQNYCAALPLCKTADYDVGVRSCYLKVLTWNDRPTGPRDNAAVDHYQRGCFTWQPEDGKNIASGKVAKQASTMSEAEKAIDGQFFETGSLTANDMPGWWTVDLGGHFIIDKIIVTAVQHTDWSSFMAGARVEIAGQDVSLNNLVTKVQCGVVSSVVSAGQQFHFYCPSSPARFVYIWRFENMLSLGHVEVQGSAVDKCGSSSYSTLQDYKLTSSSVTKTTGAESVADCSAQCYRHPGCTTFSFSKTADSTANCIFADDPVDYDNAPGWTSHVFNQ